MSTRVWLLVAAMSLAFGSCKEDDWVDGEKGEKSDRIVLRGKVDQGEAVALLHGRMLRNDPKPCFRKIVCDEEIVRVGNFFEAAGCASDVTIFSRSNALFFSTTPPWRNENEEEMEVHLEDKVKVPLRIFILGGDFATKKAIADVAIMRAEQIYNASGCGLKFLTEGPFDMTEVLNGRKMSCSLLGEVEDEIAHRGLSTVNAINVYYSPLLESGDQGERCSGLDTVMVSDRGDGETLAHELGHTMFLEHTDRALSQVPENIMQPGAFRKSAERGQCFRANLEPKSAVHRLGRGSGSVSRKCHLFTQSPGCPGLEGVKCKPVSPQ